MLTPKTRSNGEKEEERVIDKWGKGRLRSRNREIGHEWVMWIGALGCGLISPMLECWGAISLVLGWTEHSPSRGGDKDGMIVGQTGAQSVVVGLKLGLFLLIVSLSLSLSLSLRVWSSVRKWFEGKIEMYNNF